MTLTALVIVVGTAGSTTNPLDLDADFEIAEATIAQLGQRVTYEHDGAAARLVRCRHADLHDDRLRAGRIDRPGRRLGCRIPRYGDARRLHRCRLHLL